MVSLDHKENTSHVRLFVKSVLWALTNHHAEKQNTVRFAFVVFFPAMSSSNRAEGTSSCLALAGNGESVRPFLAAKACAREHGRRITSNLKERWGRP